MNADEVDGRVVGNPQLPGHQRPVLVPARLHDPMRRELSAESVVHDPPSSCKFADVTARLGQLLAWYVDLEDLSFILQGHPTATPCYAWELDGRVTTMLRIGPIDSPAMAVRASILAVAECE